MVDGMLFREFVIDPLLNKDSVIILDLELVVMCATMNVQKMQSYFYCAPLLNILELERGPERYYLEASSRP